MITPSSNQLWKVYMIQAKSGKLYTGITNNLERRLNQHKTQIKGARFFRFSDPESVVFQETHLNRSEASKRESSIKKMSRQEKLTLINFFLKNNQSEEDE
jgi:putative endonuclease